MASWQVVFVWVVAVLASIGLFTVGWLAKNVPGWLRDIRAEEAAARAHDEEVAAHIPPLETGDDSWYIDDGDLDDLEPRRDYMATIEPSVTLHFTNESAAEHRLPLNDIIRAQQYEAQQQRIEDAFAGRHDFE